MRQRVASSSFKESLLCQRRSGSLLCCLYSKKMGQMQDCFTHTEFFFEALVEMAVLVREEEVSLCNSVFSFPVSWYTYRSES